MYGLPFKLEKILALWVCQNQPIIIIVAVGLWHGPPESRDMAVSPEELVSKGELYEYSKWMNEWEILLTSFPGITWRIMLAWGESTFIQYSFQS